MREAPLERAEADIQVIEAIGAKEILQAFKRCTMTQNGLEKPEELREGFKSIISAEK